MKVYIQTKARTKREFQFYMQQFTEACAGEGFPAWEAKGFWVKKSVRKVLALFYRAGLRRLLPRPKQAVIVATRGRHVLRDAMPQALTAEVIPMFWDSWPRGWKRQVEAIRVLNCRTCLFSSSEAAARLSQELPDVQALWVPEGIDPTPYKGEKPLRERRYQVYELGRQKADYHAVLARMHKEGKLTTYFANRYASDGKLLELAFATNQELEAALPEMRVIISFPACDTHPTQTGGIETLTQRYWEAMLSGALIVGRAPKELIDLLGYNPVIEVDTPHAEEQLLQILENPDEWQPLADRNLKAALQHAPWALRAHEVRLLLRKQGYKV